MTSCASGDLEPEVEPKRKNRRKNAKPQNLEQLRQTEAMTSEDPGWQATYMYATSGEAKNGNGVESGRNDVTNVNNGDTRDSMDVTEESEQKMLPMTSHWNAHLSPTERDFSSEDVALNLSLRRQDSGEEGQTTESVTSPRDFSTDDCGALDLSLPAKSSTSSSPPPKQVQNAPTSAKNGGTSEPPLSFAQSTFNHCLKMYGLSLPNAPHSHSEQDDVTTDPHLYLPPPVHLLGAPAPEVRTDENVGQEFLKGEN